MKHVKCLFERKRVCVNRLTWADSENHALEVVWITYMGRFFQVSSGQSYYFAWFWDCIWFNSRSSPVWVYISQPRWILVKRPMGRLTSSTMGWFPLLFGPLGAFLCTCCWEHLLDLRIRNMWSLSGQGSGPLTSAIIFILEYLSTEDKLQLLSLGPIYLLSQTPWETWTPRNLYWEDKAWRSLFWTGMGLVSLPSWGHRALILSH